MKKLQELSEMWKEAEKMMESFSDEMIKILKEKIDAEYKKREIEDAN